MNACQRNSARAPARQGSEMESEAHSRVAVKKEEPEIISEGSGFNDDRNRYNGSASHDSQGTLQTLRAGSENAAAGNDDNCRRSTDRGSHLAEESTRKVLNSSPTVLGKLEPEFATADAPDYHPDLNLASEHVAEAEIIPDSNIPRIKAEPMPYIQPATTHLPPSASEEHNSATQPEADSQAANLAAAKTVHAPRSAGSESMVPVVNSPIPPSTRGASPERSKQGSEVDISHVGREGHDQVPNDAVGTAQTHRGLEPDRVRSLMDPRGQTPQNLLDPRSSSDEVEPARRNSLRPPTRSLSSFHDAEQNDDAEDPYLEVERATAKRVRRDRFDFPEQISYAENQRLLREMASMAPRILSRTGGGYHDITGPRLSYDPRSGGALDDEIEADNQHRHGRPQRSAGERSTADPGRRLVQQAAGNFGANGSESPRRGSRWTDPSMHEQEHDANSTGRSSPRTQQDMPKKKKEFAHGELYLRGQLYLRYQHYASQREAELEQSEGSRRPSQRRFFDGFDSRGRHRFGEGRIPVFEDEMHEGQDDDWKSWRRRKAIIPDNDEEPVVRESHTAGPQGSALDENDDEDDPYLADVHQVRPRPAVRKDSDRYVSRADINHMADPRMDSRTRNSVSPDFEEDGEIQEDRAGLIGEQNAAEFRHSTQDTWNAAGSREIGSESNPFPSVPRSRSVDPNPLSNVNHHIDIHRTEEGMQDDHNELSTPPGVANFLPMNANADEELTSEQLERIPARYRRSHARVALLQEEVRRNTPGQEDLRIDLLHIESRTFIEGNFEGTFEGQLQKAVHQEVRAAKKRAGGRRRRKTKSCRNRF